jgi:hypothetical protein
MAKFKIGKGQPKQVIPDLIIHKLIDYMPQIQELHEKIESIKCNHICQCGPQTIEENKVYNVTHNVIASKDTKARKHSLLSNKRCSDQYNIVLNELDKLTISNHILLTKIEALESKKPEEKQILTVEKHTETIKEIEYRTDKRMIMIIALTAIINFVAIMVLK